MSNYPQRLRIGLVEGREVVNFTISDRFSVADSRGNILMQDGPPGLKWRVRIGSAKPAEFVYKILWGEFATEQQAVAIQQSLKEKGIEAELLAYGQKISSEVDNIKYRIVSEGFDHKSEAVSFCREFFNYKPRVIKQKVRDPEGRVELFDLRYERAVKAENMIRIIPDSPTTEVVFHLKGSRDRHLTGQPYRGVIEFGVDNQGMLLAIFETSLEGYVKGVVSAVISPDAPLEALKAQAIAVRGCALAGLGIEHSNDPYDLCATYHCQPFNWSNNRGPKIDEAVESTKGMILVYKGKLCKSLYSPNCGGHTEDSPEAECLRGIYDVEGGSLKEYPSSLEKERDVERWISSYPHVYCNPQEDIFDQWKEFFRWEEEYTRRELEEIIKEKTGEDIGTIYDLIPLQRGVSGRIIELKILGSRKDLHIEGEFEIQRVLSEDFLNSTCFVVHTEVMEDGTPLRFILIGAGKGQGVGMCQAGAVVMATQGKDFQDILAHYYNGAQLYK